jgi:hypothetical protein
MTVYKITKLPDGVYDIAALRAWPDTAPVYLNNGEDCRTLDELREFIGDLAAMTRSKGANCLPQEAIDDLWVQFQCWYGSNQ